MKDLFSAMLKAIEDVTQREASTSSSGPSTRIDSLSTGGGTVFFFWGWIFFGILLIANAIENAKKRPEPQN